MSAPRTPRPIAKLIAVAILSALLFAAPASLAQADNCSPGDFGAAQGCAPPAAAGGDKAESWPPTDVDWPPSADSDADGGASSQHDAAAAPIVMPESAGPAKHPPLSEKSTVTTAPIVTPGS